MMPVLLPILLLALVSPPQASLFKLGSSRHAYLATPETVRYYPQAAYSPLAAPLPAAAAQATKGAPLLEQTSALKTSEQAYEQTAAYGSPLVLQPTRAVSAAFVPLAPKAAFHYQQNYLNAYPSTYYRQHYEYPSYYPYSSYPAYRYAYGYATPRYVHQAPPLFALEQHHSYVRDFEEPETLDGKLGRIKSSLSQVLAKLTSIHPIPEQQGYVLVPSAPAIGAKTNEKPQIVQQQEQHVEQQRELEPEPQQQIQEQHTEQHTEQQQTLTDTKLQSPIKEQAQAKGFKELDSQRSHVPGHQDNESGFKGSGPL